MYQFRPDRLCRVQEFGFCLACVGVRRTHLICRLFAFENLRGLWGSRVGVEFLYAAVGQAEERWPGCLPTFVRSIGISTKDHLQL